MLRPEIKSQSRLSRKTSDDFSSFSGITVQFKVSRFLIFTTRQGAVCPNTPGRRRSRLLCRRHVALRGENGVSKLHLHTRVRLEHSISSAFKQTRTFFSPLPHPTNQMSHNHKQIIVSQYRYKHASRTATLLAPASRPEGCVLACHTQTGECHQRCFLLYLPP